MRVVYIEGHRCGTRFYSFPFTKRKPLPKMAQSETKENVIGTTNQTMVRLLWNRTSMPTKQMSASMTSQNPIVTHAMRVSVSVFSVLTKPMVAKARTMMKRASGTGTAIVRLSISSSPFLCRVGMTLPASVQETKTSRTQPSRHSFRKRKVNETPGDTLSALTTR